MNVVVAPQELKGSLTAARSAKAIAAGVRRGLPDADVTVLPLADGGPGTLDVLIAARRGTLRRARVSGPLGAPVRARWGRIGETAVVETAEACGLVLLAAGELDPRRATTYGAGEIVRAALEAGCRRFLFGIGGSATNDGGAGLAQALGFRLLDATGADLPHGGAALARLDRIDATGADRRLRECRVEVAVDVQNPLCGPNGATAIYGPQKGVQPEQVAMLDAALFRLGTVIESDLQVPVLELPGGGAAGGLGAGLAGFLQARLRPGFALVAEAVDLERHIEAADLVFTGEGRLDGQTRFGKTIAGVAGVARRHGVPVIALVGGIAPDFEVGAIAGLTAAFALPPRPASLAEAQAEAGEWLAALAEQCARLVRGLQEHR